MTQQRQPAQSGFRWLLPGAVVVLAILALLLPAPAANAADFVVTTQADRGAGSLRAAVQAANATPAADTITFAPGVVRIDLRSTIPISSAIAIVGPGASQLTVGRATRGTFDQFTIDTDADVSIRGLTMTGTAGGSGRGVVVDGVHDLVLEDVALLDQTVTDEEGGAGIAIWEITGDVLLDRVQVLRNTATWSAGLDLESPDSPDITIKDSLFSDNTAEWGEGGGLYALTAGVIQLSGSQFTRNTSAQSPDPDAYGDPSGGAVFVRSAAQLIVTGSQFAVNRAGAFGGAIDVDELLGATRIDDSGFSDNSAGLSGGAINISRHDSGAFEVTGSAFQRNAALAGDGGAVDVEAALSVLIESSEFVGNQAPDGADGDGGAVYVDTAGEGVHVVETTFADNAAGFGGGGLMLAGVEGLSQVERSTFSSNSSGNGDGASIAGFGVENDLVVINSTLVEGSPAIAMNAGPFGGGGAVRLHDSTVRAPGAAALDSAYGLELRETAVDSLGAAVAIVAGTLAIAWSALTDAPDPADYGTYLDGGGNRVGVPDLQLGDLTDNGGPTLTMLPFSTSPLLDGGDPMIVDPPPTDQRGLPRLSGPAIDIGAVEVQVPLPPDAAHSTLEVAPAGPLVADGLQHFTATATVRNADDEVVADAIVTFEVPTEVAASQPECVTDAAGRCSIDLASVVAGTYPLGALLDGELVGSRLPLTFIAGPASPLTSTIEASPPTIVPDGADAARVVVRLHDAHGNPLTSSGGEVTLTTTFGKLSLVTDHDDGTYTASLTASATGRATVAFAIDGEAGSAVAEVLAAQRLPTTGPLLAGTVLTALGLLVAGALVRLRRART